MRYEHPVDLPDQPEGFTLTAPDIPETITEGDTRDEALARAVDALVTALSFYVDDGKPLSAPSASEGRIVVSVPLLEAALRTLGRRVVLEVEAA